MVREVLTEAKLETLSPNEAAAYFVALRAEGLNAHEDALLAAWLQKDVTHRATFESAARGWQSFDAVGDNELLKAMRAHALTQPRGRNWQSLTGVAGMLAAACAALVFLVPGFNPWARPDQVMAYSTSRGQVREIRLADGSNVTLDADSLLVARIGKARSLDLQRGRAYFSVVHDANRPFTVAAGANRIADVGTRFDVNTVGAGVTVTLIEGSVVIANSAAGSALVTLLPGQQLIARDGHEAVRNLGAASASAIAWRTGLINFDDVPLSEAAAIMNRYDGDAIAVADTSVAGIRVSGQFHAGETRRFAETLAELHNLKLNNSAGRIALEAR